MAASAGNRLMVIDANKAVANAADAAVILVAAKPERDQSDQACTKIGVGSVDLVFTEGDDIVASSMGEFQLVGSVLSVFTKRFADALPRNDGTDDLQG
jgi:hypothetical protein